VEMATLVHGLKLELAKPLCRHALKKSLLVGAQSMDRKGRQSS
jgi:hypothetical protein